MGALSHADELVCRDGGVQPRVRSCRDKDEFGARASDPRCRWGTSATRSVLRRHSAASSQAKVAVSIIFFVVKNATTACSRSKAPIN